MMPITAFVELIKKNYQKADPSKEWLLAVIDRFTDAQPNNIDFFAVDIKTSIFDSIVELLQNPTYQSIQAYFLQKLLYFIYLYKQNNTEENNQRYDNNLTHLYNMASNYPNEAIIQALVKLIKAGNYSQQENNECVQVYSFNEQEIKNRTTPFLHVKTPRLVIWSKMLTRSSSDTDNTSNCSP